MRILVLTLLIFAMVLNATGSWTLQVIIVIPLEMVPYYEWLISFPGIQVAPEKPKRQETLTEFGSLPQRMI